jgi:DNA-binding MarR family transcriptional regulator
VQQISTAFFSVECAGYDLTSVQYASLKAIEANPGVDATRLSTLIAFDRSTIGDVLERLEAKGWISRRPSSQDKRIKILTVTPAGSALLAQVLPAVQAVQEQIMEPLSQDERATLLLLLGKLAHVHNHVTRAPLQQPERTTTQ